MTARLGSIENPVPLLDRLRWHEPVPASGVCAVRNAFENVHIVHATTSDEALAKSNDRLAFILAPKVTFLFAHGAESTSRTRF